MPELANYEMLWRASASSNLKRTVDDQGLAGVRGQRIYLIAADGSDIPRAMQVLVKRLWLADCGYIKVSTSGQILQRTLVDTSVWQASRLDYIAGAVCDQGVEQERQAPTLIVGGKDASDNNRGLPFVDTREVFPELDPSEEAQVAAQIANARLTELEREVGRRELVFSLSGLPVIVCQAQSSTSREFVRDDAGGFVLADNGKRLTRPSTVTRVERLSSGSSNWALHEAADFGRVMTGAHSPSWVSKFCPAVLGNAFTKMAGRHLLPLSGASDYPVWSG